MYSKHSLRGFIEGVFQKGSTDGMMHKFDVNEVTANISNMTGKELLMTGRNW